MAAKGGCLPCWSQGCHKCLNECPSCAGDAFEVYGFGDVSFWKQFVSECKWQLRLQCFRQRSDSHFVLDLLAGVVHIDWVLAVEPTGLGTVSSTSNVLGAEACTVPLGQALGFVVID